MTLLYNRVTLGNALKLIILYVEQRDSGVTMIIGHACIGQCLSVLGFPRSYFVGKFFEHVLLADR